MAPRIDGRRWLARTLIVGNSGSGKSWLAGRLAERLGIDALDLDAVHWEPGGYAVARDKQAALTRVRAAAAAPNWIIEGVYGWLAEAAAPEATALIWLAMPRGECLDNLRRRGLRRGGDEEAFQALLAWAENYDARETSSSYAGHAALFSAFPRRKLRLSSRREIVQFLASAFPSQR